MEGSENHSVEKKKKKIKNLFKKKKDI